MSNFANLGDNAYVNSIVKHANFLTEFDFANRN